MKGSASTRHDMLAGMADAIWADAGETGLVARGRRKHAPAQTPKAALEAAREFAAILCEGNASSLEEIYETAVLSMRGKHDDPRTVGAALAEAALGDVGWARLNVPALEVELEDDGEFLSWKVGGSSWSVEKANPTSDWPASEVQSLLFDVDIFSEARAKAWAKQHGFKHSAIDTTEHYHRIRQFEPDGSPCRTISFGTSGIKAVVCAVGKQSSSTKSNPVGDHVDVVSGPGRGQRGVVRAETGRVAQVEFESGRRGHVERSALRTRGGSRSP